MKIVIEVDEKKYPKLREECWKAVIEALAKTMNETTADGHVELDVDLYEDELGIDEKKLRAKPSSRMRMGKMKFSNYKIHLKPRKHK